MRNAARILVGTFLVFVFLSGGLFILMTFGNPAFDTTSITNAGFAVFAGCASVCFSWARNTEDQRVAGKIKLSGERFFFSSLCFVVASLLKFITLHRQELINSKILSIIHYLFPVFNILGGIIFLAAYVAAWTSIIEVLSRLLRRVFD